MGVDDVRTRTSAEASGGQMPSRDQGEMIDKLNKEWREKRDSYRKRTSECEAPLSHCIAEASTTAGSNGSSSGRSCFGAAARQPLPSGNDGGLSAAAASGALEACRQILARGLTGPNCHGPDGTTPLCAAAMWDNADIVKLLIQAEADVGLTNNSGSRPTALHVAAMQEHGKVCMMLLAAKADPCALDGKGVTPVDLASCSEAVWPIFAAQGCTRTPKDELLARGVIRKASAALERDLVGGSASGNRGILPEFSRPGSAYVVTAHNPPRPGSALHGAGSSMRPGSRLGTAATRPIDILEESPEKAQKDATPLAGSSDIPAFKLSSAGRSASGYAQGRLASLNL